MRTLLHYVCCYCTDQLLAAMQRRCKHPPGMVAFDILDGSGNGIGVSYCNRCGAVSLHSGDVNKQIREPIEWRRPNPNLWRG